MNKMNLKLRLENIQNAKYLAILSLTISIISIVLFLMICITEQNYTNAVSFFSFFTLLCMFLSILFMILAIVIIKHVDININILSIIIFVDVIYILFLFGYLDIHNMASYITSTFAIYNSTAWSKLLHVLVSLFIEILLKLLFLFMMLRLCNQKKLEQQKRNDLSEGSTIETSEKEKSI